MNEGVTEPGLETRKTDHIEARIDLKRFADGLIATVGMAVAASLNLIATRGERVVLWDSFQYITYARAFSHELPTHLGDRFPFGYPLVAAPLVAVGVHPYAALLGVSLLSYGALLYMLSQALGRDERTRNLRIFVPALGAVPLMFGLALDAMSEMTFLSLVFLATLFFAKWSRPGWITATVPVIVAAFSVRYAGIFLLLAASVWVAYDRLTVRSFPFAHALSAIASCAVVMAVLLYSNVAMTGFATGGTIIPGDRAILAVPYNLVGFGLEALALFAQGWYARLSDTEIPRAILGLLLLVPILGLPLVALRRSSNPLCKAAAVVVICYVATIVLLHSVSLFWDPGRFVLPVVPLLVLIGAQVFGALRSAVAGLAGCVSIVGLVAAARGTVVERNADITEVAHVLQLRLDPDTRVFINIDALSLASRLDGNIVVAAAEYLPIEGYANMIERRRIRPHEGDYLVVATDHSDRRPGAREFGDAWLQYLTSLKKPRTVRVVFENQNAIVVQYAR